MMWHISVAALFFLSLFIFGVSEPSLVERDYETFQASVPLFTSLHDLEEKEPPKEKIDTFKDLELEARAVYVFDLSNKKVLFSRNEKEARGLASLTKLMTALLAEERVPDGIPVPI